MAGAVPVPGLPGKLRGWAKEKVSAHYPDSSVPQWPAAGEGLPAPFRAAASARTHQPWGSFALTGKGRNPPPPDYLLHICRQLTGANSPPTPSPERLLCEPSEDTDGEDEVPRRRCSVWFPLVCVRCEIRCPPRAEHRAARGLERQPCLAPWHTRHLLVPKGPSGLQTQSKTRHTGRKRDSEARLGTLPTWTPASSASGRSCLELALGAQCSAPHWVFASFGGAETEAPHRGKPWARLGGCGAGPSFAPNWP